VVVVSAPADIQRQRVMARPGMTGEKLTAILGRQVPDEMKRSRADYLIDTSVSLEETQALVLELIGSLIGREGIKYQQLILVDSSSC
jgi:dephospho-CoA kinase